MVSVYNDAPQEDRPGIVAEVVRFARDTIAALHPELLEDDPQPAPQPTAKTGPADAKIEKDKTATTDKTDKTDRMVKTATAVKKGKGRDDWISSDSEEDIEILSGLTGRHPESSRASVDGGTSVALQPRLDRLITPFSRDISTDRLEDIMGQFRDRLVALGEFPITRGKKASTSSWSPARATALANHVFTDMIGGLKGRLQPIINSYSNVDHMTGVSSRTAILASDAVTREGYPKLVREFCLSVAKGIEIDPANLVLQQQVNEFRKFQALETLKRRAAEHDEEILNFLKRQGLQAERGRMWVSVMVTFLVDLFEIGTRRQLNNLCTSGKAISTLVEVFGFGSLALLHATSTRK